MSAFSAKDYTKEQINTILNVMVKVLQDPKKKPVLPEDLKPEQVEAMIAKVTQGIENSGLRISNKNINELYVQLATAIVVAHVAEHDPIGAQKTIDMSLRDDLTNQEKVQLTTALAFISAMQNTPGLKLRPELAFQDNLNPADKKEFDDSLAIALDTLINRKLDPTISVDPKAVGDFKDKVAEKLNDPKSKGKPLDKVADELAKDFNDPLLGKSLGPILVVAGNQMGRADTIDTSIASPIHMLSNTVFNPIQSLTGGNSIAAERESELGETLAEAVNEPLAEAGISTSPHPQFVPPGH